MLISVMFVPPQPRDFPLSPVFSALSVASVLRKTYSPPRLHAIVAPTTCRGGIFPPKPHPIHPSGPFLPLNSAYNPCAFNRIRTLSVTTGYNLLRPRSPLPSFPQAVSMAHMQAAASPIFSWVYFTVSITPRWVGCRVSSVQSKSLSIGSFRYFAISLLHYFLISCFRLPRTIASQVPEGHNRV
jgi:hypothetical protein